MYFHMGSPASEYSRNISQYKHSTPLRTDTQQRHETTLTVTTTTCGALRWRDMQAGGEEAMKIFYCSPFYTF